MVVLVDGEEAWSRVADDLETATSEVQIATWMCRPDLELRRAYELAAREPEEREAMRMGAVLERLARAGVKVRLLVWGMAGTPLVDRWMRRWFWRGDDNIDLLEQDHPSIVGSYHQKTLTIDGHVAYCGGMNIKENDWDTTAHRVFDVRRFPASARPIDRVDTLARFEPPPFVPRHDLVVRIEGPAAFDLLGNFAERWRESLAARRSVVTRIVDYARSLGGAAPHPSVPPPEPPPAQERASVGSHWVQIVRTTPGGEEGILGAYYRSIYNARRYIYIENQYFRSPLVGRALAQALARNPRLRLVVAVWPVNDGEVSLLDPSGYWTARTLETIRAVRPEFRLTRLVAWERDADGVIQWVPIDLHAKVMIIDDVWVTVGSANINDRGFKTESEINAVILDRGIARGLRIRLMAEHLELAEDDPRLADVDAAFDLWDACAAENPGRRTCGEAPRGRVHHFIQKGLARPPFGIGSGLF